ncbi:UPF0488 protein CG14286 [Teleopsis dalmanni]|uniref:UPF0488 protein CG14286 n=1 Tax=Teleopsis dalmanni TaxID=139649 RepID=UPI0018CFDA2A|nr:UPF0488 protein CG14286 [Teleopsis dalmanni]
MYKKKSVKSIYKPPPTVSGSKPTISENDMQFELELCWCVQQLETAIYSGKLNGKIAEDTVKNIKILKSTTAPLIKKRQVMKAALGDYRSTMKAEEKKLSLAPKQVKFTNATDVNKKSSFVKKSALMTSGKDFRFNFDEQTEVNNTTDQSSENMPDVVANKDLKLNLGSEFKFNFVVDETSEDLTLKNLAIKN